MAERVAIALPEFVVQEPKSALQHRLLSYGINLPEQPLPSNYTPGEWLVRGTSSDVGLKTGFMNPQSGEMGTNGVFFGDCYSTLMYPKGLFYLYNSQQLSQQGYINYPSDQSNEILQWIANCENLNMNSISGYVEAESRLFRGWDIYQQKKGIYTAHVPVDVRQAQAIFMYPGFMDDAHLNTLPPEIHDRLMVI